MPIETELLEEMLKLENVKVEWYYYAEKPHQFLDASTRLIMVALEPEHIAECQRLGIQVKTLHQKDEEPRQLLNLWIPKDAQAPIVADLPHVDIEADLLWWSYEDKTGIKVYLRTLSNHIPEGN